jgi:hypothetical protein
MLLNVTLGKIGKQNQMNSLGKNKESLLSNPIKKVDQTTFEKVLQEIHDLHTKKQSDYGRPEQGDPFANVRASEDFGIPGWLGAVIRANDKVRRIQKYARGGTMINESVEDSLLDAAVYFMIALCLFREQNDGSK